MKLAKIPISEIEVFIERERNSEIHEMQHAHIEKFGQIQPIKVAVNKNKQGKKYLLVYGQGRVESAKSLGQREIEAIIDERLTEVEHIEQWFTENNSRRDLSPYDTARILVEERDAGTSLQELANRFRLSTGYASHMIKIFKKGSHKLKSRLSKKTKHKRKTDKKELKMNQAAVIVSAFDDHKDQDAVVDTIEEMGITSTREIRTVVKKAKELKKEKEKEVSTDNLIRSIRTIEDDLKNTSDKYYAFFNRKELLRKAYETLCDDKFFLKIAEENKLSSLI